jgi:hypothetical protein
LRHIGRENFNNGSNDEEFGKMMTFCTIPKSRASIDTLQTQGRTFANWQGLPIAKQILVLTEKEIKTSPQGTPLLDDAFAKISEMASFDLIVYSNSDILFTAELVATSLQVSERLADFLMVGRRTDLSSLLIPSRYTDRALTDIASRRGMLHSPAGIDYFVFRKRMIQPIHMLPFAVGRPAWDNWFIARCLELGYPVVDATSRVLAVHQGHDFTHIPGGWGECRRGVEAQENIRLAGNKLATISNATIKVEDLLR